jgi:hypothetical protein
MRPSISIPALVAFSAQRGLGYITPPPTHADPSTVSDCSNWVVAFPDATCALIADVNSITLSDFELVYVSIRAYIELK